MDYTCRNTVIQNLKDAGCDQNTINSFLEGFDQDNYLKQKQIIGNHRKNLVDAMHQKQKEIDMLDYMTLQLEKCHCQKGD
ncbi:MAG: hypothetical protein PHH04_06400 [Thomasclavelia sp.]|nr:hypothetical protein [Thomasclavelia sp.]